MRDRDECRTRLLYGEWLRREGQRLDARRRLRAAHEGFAAMGALAFAERALQELRATGDERAAEPPRPPTSSHRKSCTSRASAVTGRHPRKWRPSSSSARTVGAHLRNIFRKLDVTSRGRLRGVDPQPSNPVAHA